MPDMPVFTDGENVEKVAEDINKLYAETVEKELDSEVKKDKEETTRRFSEIADLGFISRNDLEKALVEQKAKTEKIEADFTKLREFLLRAKAQGRATIPTEEKDEKKELKEIYGDLINF